MELIHDYIFHYNHVTDKWSAVKREDYNNLFNGGPKLSSSSVDTLVEIIKKTGGDEDKIKKLLKQK